MTNEEAAKRVVELYGLWRSLRNDPDCRFAEAVSMAAAALIYGKEVNPNDER